MDELSKQYSPKETEGKWYKYWEENNLFSAKVTPGKKPFCIVIPPPNVTGILHMGHALNNTIQDILIRYKRMQGLEALWMPGTDHAGIATQNVVEKDIAREGLKRDDLGREKFIERVWQWKQEYGSTIIHQLKKLGASCDWARIRFTMDEEYSKAVKEVFVRLYKKGLIYQGEYIINWCPRCQTALSDEEAPHNEVKGSLYYLKYPFKDKQDEFVIVATTRPETMLGDTAVAVNPKDKRFKKFIGRTLILPLVNREIKIIADNMVDAKFGTGAVKVTPAHDPNDFLLGKKHKLEFINCLHPDAKMNEKAGRYNGMDRFRAREVILKDLKERGLVEKIVPHQLSAGHCYRCHTIIEPYLSKQWFVKMKPLAKPAIDVVKKGEIKFYPRRWMKVYLNWMENIQDWCISRQIWWGHRIPIWYCLDCNEIIVSVDEPVKCKRCNSNNLKQDEDVLDTWFSSWLWPFATFYWPFINQEPRAKSREQAKKELDYFYPTSVLITAQEIIFFWVARMIMAGLEFIKDIPFRDVYIHGTVRDLTGKKMSKSLGNVLDPLDIIQQYGADALRFSLVSLTATGQDVFLSKEKFQMGRNFANKIWNASRFVLMNLEKDVNTDLCVFAKNSKLDLASSWILSQLYQAIKDVERSIKDYNFNEAANILYEFFWHKYCDWYLEIIKPKIKENTNQIIMYKVLEKTLRCLHPFMPFITEEIWQRLPTSTEQMSRLSSIMLQSLPHIQGQFIDKRINKDMQLIIDIVVAIRNIRAEWNVAPKINVSVLVETPDRNITKLVQENGSYIKTLAKVGAIKLDGDLKGLEKCASSVVGKVSIYIPLEGVVEIEKEKRRIKKQLDNFNMRFKNIEKKLTNKDFLRRAPKDIIQSEKRKLAELKDSITRIKNNLKGLK